jgi:hypothetical protein
MVGETARSVGLFDFVRFFDHGFSGCGLRQLLRWCFLGRHFDIFVTRRGLLEVANTLAESVPNLWEFSSTEYNQNDHKDEHQFTDTQPAEQKYFHILTYIVLFGNRQAMPVRFKGFQFCREYDRLCRWSS